MNIVFRSDRYREAHRIAGMKYVHSENGSKIRSEYAKSEQGLLIRKKSAKNYLNTKNGMERLKIYQRSDKYKELSKRKHLSYKETEHGRAVLRNNAIIYRARKMGVFTTLTTSEWKGIVESYDHRCVYCNKKLTRVELDHVVPISMGGGHTADNVAPACRGCNASKNNKKLIVWMYERTQLPCAICSA